MATTVVIVDDHAVFRHFARRLLEAEGFEVVGVGADGSSALGLTVSLKPQLVLLDVVLPDMDGFAVAEALATAAPGSCVVLTSSRDADDFGERLRRTPARGFIHKHDLSAARLSALFEAA
jgi:DNA-binding NarL/FixJ family response regulator